MILLIHSLEIILLLLVASLGYRVVKGYQSEYISSPGEDSELEPKVTIISNCSGEIMDGKSIVEAYIDDFFTAEPAGFDHPLSVFKQTEQIEIKKPSIEQVTKPNVENTDRSISSKVIDAMMAEADLACAS